jgi:hypothetical protein
MTAVREFFVGVLCSGEDTSTQEIEAGAAVHGALDQLQTVNVAFNGAVAPVVLESGANGSFISREMFGEGRKRAMGCEKVPRWPSIQVASPYDPEELPGDICTASEVR